VDLTLPRMHQDAAATTGGGLLRPVFVDGQPNSQRATKRRANSSCHATTAFSVDHLLNSLNLDKSVKHQGKLSLR
jgi:hypothetical protein